MGLEGMVSKHRESAYRGGRFRHWIKVKNRQHPAFARVLDRSANTCLPTGVGRSAHDAAFAAFAKVVIPALSRMVFASFFFWEIPSKSLILLGERGGTSNPRPHD